jgi:tRNA A-37 threonylcarbamoyl transferase component Bud32
MNKLSIKSLSKKDHTKSKKKFKKRSKLSVSKKKISLDSYNNPADAKLHQYHINNYERYVKEFLSNTEYEIYDYINRGNFGSVFLICKKLNGGDCKAIKVSAFQNKYIKKFKQEIRMQQEFYKHGLAVQIHNAFIRELDDKFNLGIVIMDLIDGTINNFLSKKRSIKVLERVLEWVIVFIRKMCKYNLIHGDMHVENFGYVITKEGKMRPVLIDFGWAQNGECQQDLELLQFMRFLDENEMNKFNAEYLFGKIIPIVQRKYPDIKNIDDVHEYWDEISDIYVANYKA